MGGVRGWAVALAFGLGLGFAPKGAFAEEFGSRACKKKIVDACGCHRVYGRRHCHPNRQSPFCHAFAAVDVSTRR